MRRNLFVGIPVLGVLIAAVVAVLAQVDGPGSGEPRLRWDFKLVHFGVAVDAQETETTLYVTAAQIGVDTSDPDYATDWYQATLGRMTVTVNGQQHRAIRQRDGSLVVAVPNSELQGTPTVTFSLEAENGNVLCSYN